MTQNRTPVLPAWLLWAVALAVCGFGLDAFPLLDNNEGLYAEIPREMLAAGDWHAWVIPHLNGLPYMEKPPLLYWLTAGALALFGEHAWAARLVPALSALGCVGWLQWFGRETGHALAGRVAGLVFITGAGVLAMSHVLMFDMLLAFLLTGALALAWRFIASEDRGALRWSYAWLALAVLAKGFVALVLFGLVVGGHSLWHARMGGGRLRALLRWFDPAALGVFLLLAAPWHVAASLAEPEFAWSYFVNEHVLRFLGERQPHDYYGGPWWYYLPRLAIFLFPWVFLLPALLGRRRLGERETEGLPAFLLLAWAAPLAFFSASSAKANYYLVAVLPFAAFHLARAAEARQWFNGLGRAFPGLVIGLAAGATAATLVIRGTTLPAAIHPWDLSATHFALLALGGAALLGGLAALLAWRAPRIGILAYTVLPAWQLAILLALLQAMGPVISTEQSARFLRHVLPGHAVYLYREFEQQSSLPFLMGRTLPVVDMRSNDLYWGDRLRPGNAVNIAPADFAARLAREKIAIVVPDRQVQDFRAAPFFAALTGERRIGNSTVFHN